MMTVENEMGGSSVVIDPNDDLASVPRSHQYILTKQVKAVFNSCPAYFSSMKDEATIPSLKKWLGILTRNNEWRLELHRGHKKEICKAFFAWNAPDACSGYFDVTTNDDKKWFPSPFVVFNQVFHYCRSISWNGFGSPGSLFKPAPAKEIATLWISRGEQIDLTKTYLWGEWQIDFLYATPNDKSGWISNSELHPLGSIADGLEWYFDKLSRNESPVGPDGG